MLHGFDESPVAFSWDGGLFEQAEQKEIERLTEPLPWSLAAGSAVLHHGRCQFLACRDRIANSFTQAESMFMCGEC